MAAIAALLVFVAIPAGTIVFNLAIAGLGVQMAKAPSQEYRELSNLYERYANVRVPQHGERSLILIDRFKSFQPQRTATATLAFDLQEFGGGPLADRARRARIEAHTYVDAECKALLKAIAADCRLSNVDVSAFRDFILMSLTLEFLQQGDFGVLDPSAKARLDIAKLDYPSGDTRFRLGSASEAADARLAIYSAIARDCGIMKKAHGSCAITRVHITSEVANWRKDAKVEVSGKAWLASFVAEKINQINNTGSADLAGDHGG